MQNLKIVMSQEYLGKQLNVYGSTDLPWFSATEVANWIENKNPSQMINPLDEDEKALYTFYRVDGSTNKLWMITENGLYEVLMLSRKPIAKQFKHEVKRILKQIRQTGGYVAENRESEFVTKYFPSFGEDTKLQMVQDLLETNKKYKNQIDKLKPQATAYKDLMTAEGYVNFIDLASVVEIGRTKLLDFLREEKVLTKQSQFNVPYGRFTKNGCFATVHEKGRNGKITTVTLVSPHGIDYIYRLIKKRHKESEFDMTKAVA